MKKEDLGPNFEDMSPFTHLIPKHFGPYEGHVGQGAHVAGSTGGFLLFDFKASEV